MKQTDNLPKVLPLRPWLPDDLRVEIEQFNDQVAAVRAAIAAEPGEQSDLRALVLGDDPDLTAIAGRRQAAELAHLALLVEARKLHRCRPDLARRAAEAGRQVAAQAAKDAASHAEELRRKAQDFNLSRDLVEEVVKADPQQQALDQAAAALKYEATMYAVQQAPDNAALAAIEDALSLWACGEVVPIADDADAEAAPLRSGMMCEVPVGGPPAARVEDNRTDAQRLVAAGLGAFTRMGDGRLAADVVEAEAIKKAAGAPPEPGDEVAEPAGEVCGQGEEADFGDSTEYAADGYPVGDQLPDDQEMVLLAQDTDADVDVDADGFDAEEGETADVQ